MKIYDNEKIEKNYLNDIKKLKKIILNKTLKQLNEDGVIVFPKTIKESVDLSDEQRVLWDKDKDYYQSGNVMGFIGVEDERLIIRSRFSKNSDDYFFKYLLSNVLDIPPVIADLNTDMDLDDEFLQLLIFLFQYYLKRAMRSGLYKVYKRNNYNDLDVKGTIDVASHIKLNTPFTGMIAYSQREFSFDNYLMQLIRHTIEFINHLPFCKNPLNNIKDEIKQIEESTPTYRVDERRKILYVNVKKTIRHGFYKDYYDLQKLCIWILMNKKHGIGYGKKRICGILFDGSWLWEEYISNLIKDWYYHPNNRKRVGEQEIFRPINCDNNCFNVGRMVPDFISKKKCEKKIIADAKYKPKDNIGKKNMDYFQILSYMIRFESNIGVFLYPEAENEREEKLFLLKGNTFEKNVEKREDMYIVKQGLNIPKEYTDYKDFVSQIKNIEKVFKGKAEKGFIV